VPKIWALILATTAKNAKTAHRCKDPGPPILASAGKNRQMCGVRAIHARIRRPTPDVEGEREGGVKLAGRNAIHLGSFGRSGPGKGVAGSVVASFHFISVK
jgi:hypothetical protein